MTLYLSSTSKKELDTLVRQVMYSVGLVKTKMIKDGYRYTAVLILKRELGIEEFNKLVDSLESNMLVKVGSFMCLHVKLPKKDHEYNVKSIDRVYKYMRSLGLTVGDVVCEEVSGNLTRFDIQLRVESEKALYELDSLVINTKNMLHSMYKVHPFGFKPCR